MELAVLEELRLCHAASVTEAMLATGGGRRFNAEAFQRTLWCHREAIMALIQERASSEQLLDDLRGALQPFGRCADIVAPGQDPVLISLPTPGYGGKTFVQLRASDFHRAASLLQRCAQ